MTVHDSPNIAVQQLTQVIRALPPTGLPDAFTGTGGRAFHPVMLMAVLFHARAHGWQGTDAIERACEFDPDMRYLCSGSLPDAGTLQAFLDQQAAPLATGFRGILDGLRHAGLQHYGRLDLGDEDPSSQVGQLLYPPMPAHRESASAGDYSSQNEGAARTSGRKRSPYLDALRVAEPVEEVRPTSQPKPAARVAIDRRRVEKWVALGILAVVVVIVTYAYVTRWPMDEDSHNAVRAWVASEYAANELAALKPTWYDPSRERLAPEIVEAALKEKNVEILSVSSRGRGDEISVRVEVAVLGGKPADGRAVRYYSMYRDPVIGWRMRSEMTALSYYTRL